MSHAEIPAQPVHVVAHTGEALVIERRQDIVAATTEVTTRREIAEWPTNEASQRAWCFDRAVAAKVLQLTQPDGPDQPDWIDVNIAWAERIRTYINGGAN